MEVGFDYLALEGAKGGVAEGGLESFQKGGHKRKPGEDEGVEREGGTAGKCLLSWVGHARRKGN